MTLLTTTKSPKPPNQSWTQTPKPRIRHLGTSGPKVPLPITHTETGHHLKFTKLHKIFWSSENFTKSQKFQKTYVKQCNSHFHQMLRNLQRYQISLRITKSTKSSKSWKSEISDFPKTYVNQWTTPKIQDHLQNTTSTQKWLKITKLRIWPKSPKWWFSKNDDFNSKKLPKFNPNQ